MQKITTALPTIKLVGVKVRTKNANEFDPATAKIGALFQTYFSQGVAQRIAHRKNPGVTFCVYTEYESDFNGDYTCFIGEAVDSLQEQPEGLSLLSIPEQTYCKFTTATGALPQVVVDAWVKIWGMSEQDFGSPRAYVADFEIYDARATDPQNSVVDILVGVE